jgi:hypothetical protein
LLRATQLLVLCSVSSLRLVSEEKLNMKFIGTVTAGVGTAPAIIGINHFYIVFDLLIEFFLNYSMQHRVWRMYENLYGCNCFYALIKIMIA